MYSQSEIVLIAACLQTHTSIITVCHTTLFPLGLELRAVASGVKGGDDYRGPRQGGGGNWLAEASLKDAQDSWRATAARRHEG